MFLVDIDYSNHQRSHDLQILTNGNNISVRNFAEEAAKEEISSYLALRYDVEKTFINVSQWSSTKTYNELDHVIYNNEVYYAINANSSDTPSNTSVNWKLGDMRNPYLIMRMIDVSVYHMYAKIPNRQTPEDVVFRYEETIKWLTGVSKGLYLANLPKAETLDNSTASLLFGGSKKINWR